MRSVESKTAEVIVMFEDSVIAVRHLHAGERFRAGGAGADLPWPSEEALDLVRMSPTGAIELCVPPELSDVLTIELLDSVLEAVHFRGGSSGSAGRGDEVPLKDEVDTGVRVATLSSGRRARVQLEQISLLIAESEAPVRQELAPPIDLRAHTSTAATALFCLFALFAIHAIPPQPASLAIDPFDLAMRGVRMRFEPPVEEHKPEPSGHGQAAAPATARKADVPRLVRIAGAMGQSRTAHGKTKEERREEAEDAASTAGVLGTVRAFQGSHTGAVFGPGSAFSSAAAAAMGDLGGTENGEETGSLAVDRWGAHPRGAVDTIGVGPVGGDGPHGPGPGRCKDCKLHDRQAKMDGDSKMPPPDVQGPIDKEVIRRAVRSQSQAFRFCYEKELQHNADLSGRVVTKFTIAPNGRIVVAVTAASTMNDPRVDACVADVFKRIQLPTMPANMGASIVTYPLAFHTAAQGL